MMKRYIVEYSNKNLHKVLENYLGKKIPVNQVEKCFPVMKKEIPTRTKVLSTEIITIFLSHFYFYFVGCTGKTRHTEASARNVPRTKAYQCRFCDAWHTTSKGIEKPSQYGSGIRIRKKDYHANT